MADLDAMLSSVSDDRYLCSAYTALQQVCAYNHELGLPMRCFLFCKSRIQLLARCLQLPLSFTVNPSTSLTCKSDWQLKGLRPSWPNERLKHR